MGLIRAALSGNTTGRQLLLNLKGAGDFLVSGQIYKPFTHSHTCRPAHSNCLSSVLWSHARSWGPPMLSRGLQSGLCFSPKVLSHALKCQDGEGREDAKPSILLGTGLPGAFCRWESLRRLGREPVISFFYFSDFPSVGVAVH